jgi:hypothetical protein
VNPARRPWARLGGLVLADGVPVGLAVVPLAAVATLGLTVGRQVTDVPALGTLIRPPTSAALAGQPILDPPSLVGSRPGPEPAGRGGQRRGAAR